MKIYTVVEQSGEWLDDVSVWSFSSYEKAHDFIDRRTKRQIKEWHADGDDEGERVEEDRRAVLVLSGDNTIERRYTITGKEVDDEH